jgi:hypothetical protein
VREKSGGGVYSYQAARILTQPFRSSTSANYLNINGLVLAYNERDATVSVGNFEQALAEYSHLTGCDFQLMSEPSGGELNNFTNYSLTSTERPKLMG